MSKTTEEKDGEKRRWKADRKSTRLNSSHVRISYAVFCLKKKIGAVSFLFGGVTATEAVISFLYLFLVATLLVALGLAISSKMASLRASLVATLILVVPISFFLFGMTYAVGVGIVHSIWRQVPQTPVWMPTAYVRADFGLGYFLLLIVLSLAGFGLPPWSTLFPYTALFR